MGVRSDAVHHGAVVSALWAAGTVPCQAHALAAFDAAWHSGAFKCAAAAPPRFSRDITVFSQKPGILLSHLAHFHRAACPLQRGACTQSV